MRRRGFLGAVAALAALPIAGKVKVEQPVEPEPVAFACEDCEDTGLITYEIPPVNSGVGGIADGGLLPTAGDGESLAALPCFYCRNKAWQEQYDALPDNSWGDNMRIAMIAKHHLFAGYST